MTTRKAIGIVLATNAVTMALLLLALWTASPVVAVPPHVEQAGALSAHGSRPAQAEPTPVPGGPGYYSVPPMELQALDSTIGYLIWGGLATTQESISNPQGITLYAAGLHLPQGARITDLVAYGYDDDDAQDFYFSVGRSVVTDILTPEWLVPWTASDTGATPFVKVVAADEDLAIVDNSVYAYTIGLNLPTANSGKELKVFRFRLDYTFDSYVPLAQKEY